MTIVLPTWLLLLLGVPTAFLIGVVAFGGAVILKDMVSSSDI